MLEVSICVGSSCHLKGSYEIIKVFEALIEAEHLEDLVKLKAAFCLGRCTNGVSVKVEDDFLEYVTPLNAGAIFRQYIAEKVRA